MCGIAGFLLRSGNTKITRETLGFMRDLLEHRGPDDAGLEILGDGSVGMAHRRLAILDLSPAGRQPMSYGDGRYRLVFNGEIYNFMELRRVLEGRGRRFRSRCDAEVILAAYAEWGSSCVDRFEGMWSFALWDDRAQTLFCSRDRFGIKPFYYFDDGRRFVYASELRAVLASGVAPIETCNDAVSSYLDAGVVDGVEKTFFSGIRRLPAGCSATVSQRGLRIDRYWRMPATDRKTTPSDDSWIRVRSCFERAVRAHLVSDVAVGASLSGGVDSSAIVATASRIREEPPVAFCARYPDDPLYDEGPYAVQVAERYRAPLHLVTPHKEELLDVLPRMIWHLEEPPLQHGIYPRWKIAERAGEEIKVLLVGQGGDEVFAGYRHHVRGALQDALRSLNPRAAVGVAKALDTGIVTAGLDWWRQRARRRLARSARPSAAPGSVLESDGDGARASRDRSRLGEILRRDTEYAILPTLLKYDDKIGMAFSVECRVPFLDRRLVDLACSLSPFEKVGCGATKLILRRAMECDLPASVCWRRSKMAYPMPFRDWLQGDLLETARDRILDGALFAEGWLKRPQTESVLARYESGGVDLSGEIWKWLCLSIWHEQRSRLTDRSYAALRTCAPRAR